MRHNFTRSGNSRRGKSGARVRRMVARADRDGWVKRGAKAHEQYMRWEKSFQNVLAYDRTGHSYWAMDRPQLLHKGRKP